MGGAFLEAGRNNITRLVMNFGTAEVNQVGTVKEFQKLIEGFRETYCPDSMFEAELTYPSFGNVAKDYKTHPIKALVENGVRVTINTDDLMIFDSSIENEYLKLYKAGTLSAEQLNEIRKRGLGTL